MVKDKVLEMTPVLFKQRRRVIDALYEARRILAIENLPRITVRIAEHADGNKLGICHMGRNYVTFSAEMVTWSEVKLKHVVWHELVHAYFNGEHDMKCPLMHPEARPQTIETLRSALKKYGRIS